ncbi:MAG: hypothetical protein VYA20_00735, partial [Candidatus Neomarinimicrobiota bacterium]|nr:hypothetical protein [Candidatus Neomarinimicrobiota bacterium]
MLSNTEKVLSVIVLFVAAAVAGSLFQYNAAMAEMERLQQDHDQHVDQVNTEFRTRVKNVELDNIGQGKKIAEGRQMILANTKLIYAKADSLGNLIDDLAYEIKRVERDLGKKIKNVERDLEGLEDNFDKEKRRTRRDISDLKKSVKKLNDEVFPPEEDEKK